MPLPIGIPAWRKEPMDEDALSRTLFRLPKRETVSSGSSMRRRWILLDLWEAVKG
jgi:hypothetical protein